jgi:hypothetical protein
MIHNGSRSNPIPPSYEQPRQQFWLDLRDTALFPNEAIRFLHDQCVPSDGDAITRRSANTRVSKRWIDAVLVSSSTFDRIIASSSLSSSFATDTTTESDDTDEEDEGYQYTPLYYTTQDITPERLVRHEPVTQQSMVMGTVVYCTEKDKTDWDIVAMSEQIMKQRQWVLVQEATTTTTASATTGTTTKSLSKHMMKQLTDLIQFLSSSWNRRMVLNLDENHYQATASGLFLASPEISTTEPKSFSILPSSSSSSSQPKISLSHPNVDYRGVTGNCGIAIVCTDRTSFVEMDTMLAEFRQLESIGTTTTTSFGITIPSSSSSENEKNYNDDVATVTQRQSPYVTALVLPLDVSIWETVYNNKVRYSED